MVSTTGSGDFPLLPLMSESPGTDDVEAGGGEIIMGLASRSSFRLFSSTLVCGGVGGGCGGGGCGCGCGGGGVCGGRQERRVNKI